MPQICISGTLRPAATSTQIVLREARRLHRAAASASLSDALPVLRRLLAAQAVPARPLPVVFRERALVQRKHVLRALAFEAGYRSWEAYSRALPGLDPQGLLLALAAERGTAQLKPWFADEAQATRFASAGGGRVMRVGRQAVVLPLAATPDVEAGR